VVGSDHHRIEPIILYSGPADAGQVFRLEFRCDQDAIASAFNGKILSHSERLAG
jgi:hypothetical protein